MIKKFLLFFGMILSLISGFFLGLGYYASSVFIVSISIFTILLFLYENKITK